MHNINNNFVKAFIQRLKDCDVQKWFTRNKNSEKLKHLAVLYQNEYCKSNYLNVIENINVRKNVTKLRTASHQSKCGTLRKHENNMCELCKKSTENLYHMLLYCDAHSDIRRELLATSNIINEPDDTKIIFLLNFDKKNEQFHKKVINYLNSIIKKHNLL